MTTQTGSSLLQLVSELQDRKRFQELNWTGDFSGYLDIVAENPSVTRNAFRCIYDMIMSYGTEEFIDAKKRLVRYKFFSDMTFDQNDAIFGLELYEGVLGLRTVRRDGSTLTLSTFGGFS